ncbi:MAG: hypothetical protein Q8O26_03660 [Phreatobacter sp.]|uniref:hypothetical protein n=1 Tax=Phreatobacter sp. TaxID=1966341 RepID=UPI00273248D1|nr:hypothetical protein [Phreatobacter sp.]MDP2800958.1 hypothetical protein [Phreatobacter sp.]
MDRAPVRPPAFAAGGLGAGGARRPVWSILSAPLVLRSVGHQQTAINWAAGLQKA